MRGRSLWKMLKEGAEPEESGGRYSDVETGGVTRRRRGWRPCTKEVVRGSASAGLLHVENRDVPQDPPARVIILVAQAGLTVVAVVPEAHAGVQAVVGGGCAG